MTTRSTDHVARGLRKLLSQFAPSKKLRGIVAAYLRQVQKIEDALWLTVDAISIDGEGIVLDRIGKIVGRARNGLSDVLFRLAIRAQIRINRSSGISADFYDVATLAANDPTVVVIARRVDIAAARIETYGLPPGGGAVMWESFKQLPSAGVALEYVFSENPASQDWLFATYGATYPGPIDTVNGDSYDGNEGGFVAASFLGP